MWKPEIFFIFFPLPPSLDIYLFLIWKDKNNSYENIHNIAPAKNSVKHSPFPCSPKEKANLLSECEVNWLI